MSEHEDRLGPCPHCHMGGADSPGVCVVPPGGTEFTADMAGTTTVLCRFCGITFQQTISHAPIPPPPAPEVEP